MAYTRRTLERTISLTGLNATTTTEVSDSFPAHKSGFLCGFELRGGGAGVLGALGKFKVEVFNKATMAFADRILLIDNIHNFTQNAVLNDSSGNPIALDKNVSNIAYENKDSGVIGLLYVKISYVSGAITSALSLNVIAKTSID